MPNAGAPGGARVVSPDRTRTGLGSRNISLVAEIETAGVVGMIHLASTRR